MFIFFKKLAIVTAAAIFALCLNEASAQAPLPMPSIDPAYASKAEPSVIRNAINGQVQDVLVELSTEEIDLLAKARHPELSQMPKSYSIEQSRALARSLDQERKNAFKSLRESVFPNKIRSKSFIIEAYDDFPIVLVHLQDVETLRILLSDPKVKAIWENKAGSVKSSGALSFIGQPQAATLGAKGANTRVAVLDTGLSNPAAQDFSVAFALNGYSVPFKGCRASWQDPSAGDLWGTGDCRIRNALNFTYGNTITEMDVEIPSNHGAIVAGVIADTAPLTQISMLQVVDSSGSVLMSNVIRALQWVMNDRLSSPPIVAVNMSFGFKPLYAVRCSNAMSSVIAQLINSGIEPVAASGNDANAYYVESPACNSGVVSVGAVTDSPIPAVNYSVCSDKALPADGILCFSNGASGSLLTLLAPGYAIGGINTGGWDTGTSFAAPFVSGAVAVLRGTGGYPSYQLSTITNMMTSQGKKVSGSAVPRLQLDAALMGNTVPPPVNPCIAHPTWCN